MIKESDQTFDFSRYFIVSNTLLWTIFVWYKKSIKVQTQGLYALLFRKSLLVLITVKKHVTQCNFMTLSCPFYNSFGATLAVISLAVLSIIQAASALPFNLWGNDVENGYCKNKYQCNNSDIWTHFCEAVCMCDGA